MSQRPLESAAQLLQAGRLADAERACRDALLANPDDVQGACMLGRIMRLTGNVQESVRVFGQLHQSRPNDTLIAAELGASLTVANLHAQALPLLEQAVRLMPEAVHWKVWLGKCRLNLAQTAEALKVLEQARAAAPDSPEVAYHLANALLAAARPMHAEPVIREFLAKQPGSLAGMLTLAEALEQLSRLEEAMALFKMVLARGPHDAALAGLARCLRARGEYDEALAVLAPVLARAPSAAQAMAAGPIYLATKRFGECRELCESALKQEGLPAPVRSGLFFSLGEAYQGLKDYDSAFRAFKRANDARPKTFRREHLLRLHQEIRSAFSPELMRSGQRSGLDAGRCVFIVGMPRSGTSLVEQILDAHPSAFGAGELTELPDTVTELAAQMGGQPPSCLRELTTELLDRGARRYLDRVGRLAPDARVITDKLPHNFERLGLINRMLPGARVIHCRRDPIDNCASCYFTPLSAWHSYSNDLSNLGWAYGQYVKLMGYWREVCDLPVLDVRYEELVGDFEAHARRIVEFAGLGWDDRCLRFYEAPRAVTTASVDQVRRPIYTSSVARWKRYGEHLRPLVESLRAAGVALPDT